MWGSLPRSNFLSATSLAVSSLEIFGRCHARSHTLTRFLKATLESRLDGAEQGFLAEGFAQEGQRAGPERLRLVSSSPWAVMKTMGMREPAAANCALQLQAAHPRHTHVQD